MAREWRHTGNGHVWRMCMSMLVYPCAQETNAGCMDPGDTLMSAEQFGMRQYRQTQTFCTRRRGKLPLEAVYSQEDELRLLRARRPTGLSNPAAACRRTCGSASRWAGTSGSGAPPARPCGAPWRPSRRGTCGRCSSPPSPGTLPGANPPLGKRAKRTSQPRGKTVSPSRGPCGHTGEPCGVINAPNKGLGGFEREGWSD